LTAKHGATSQDTITWRGEHEVVLHGLGGVLTMTPECGNGIRAGQLGSDVVTIRARGGGERLHSHPGRPRRSVKNLLQEAMLPAWERARLPFIYCGDTLVCIPGVAVDHRYVAGEGEPAISPGWRLT
jgi:tRNA(Ile)-lysidine synthase